MQAVTEWVKQIVIFYILSNLFISVFPNSGYKKYVRTFVGILLIMLVAEPLLSFFGNSSKLDSMLNMELAGLEHADNVMWMKLNDMDSHDAVIDAYKAEIQKSIDRKAWEYALYVNDCRIEVDTDSKSENFGMITKVSVSVSECKKSDISVEIKKIDAKKIDVGSKSREYEGEYSENEQISPECSRIKEYISVQYGVAPENITILLTK